MTDGAVSRETDPSLSRLPFSGPDLRPPSRGPRACTFSVP